VARTRLVSSAGPSVTSTEPFGDNAGGNMTETFNTDRGRAARMGV